MFEKHQLSSLLISLVAGLQTLDSLMVEEIFPPNPGEEQMLGMDTTVLQLKHEMTNL